MRTSLKTTRLFALVVLAVAVAVAPASAQTQQTVLYELTENMKLDSLGNPTVRTATAALQGTAPAGSPLCPAQLLQVLVAYGLASNTEGPCTVTAIGNDSVDLGTGAGELWGKFAVVVNADNPVDAAELVVMTGKFGGKMQILADAQGLLPLIALTGGELKYEQVFGQSPSAFGLTKTKFTGMFRLPFAVEYPEGSGNFVGPFYLADDGSTPAPGDNEYSLGAPTVRVEINWQ